MSDETKQIILTMLKQGLEIITEYMDAESKAAKDLELMQYIDSAISFIDREGITLIDEDTSDQMLVSMYAMWLYDKRKTTGSKYTSYYIQNMPRMLRYNLNNRLMQEKAREVV
jgi:hypothetical protein